MQEKRRFSKRIEKNEVKKGKDKRGVIYLSHIPHGFYEKQMYSFFSQFGEVTRLKLIRSKKTGKSKHFAFIEFEYEEVAKIAAETMDNYLMCQKLLKCKLMPLEEVKPLTFKNWNKVFRVVKTRRKAIREHNMTTTDPEKIERKRINLKAKREKLQEKLNSLGIDYDVMNIKINEDFVPPEMSHATAEEITRAQRKIFGCDIKSTKSDSSEKKSQTKKSDQKSSSKDVMPGDCTAKDEEEKKVYSVKDGTAMAQEVIEFGVMVTDLEETEISFKTPSPKARITRKSIGVFSEKKLKRKIEDKSKDIDEDKEASSVVEEFTTDADTKTPKRATRMRKMEQLESPNEGASENKSKKATPRKNTTGKKIVPMTEKKKKLRKRRKLNETM